MDVRTELFNIDNDSTNYLSVGLTQLPSLYFIFYLLYLCFLGLWISVCFKNERYVHQVHLLMTGLLIMKGLSLFYAAEDYQYVKVIGTPRGWNVLHYIFQFASNVLLFVVIILIGAGWAYLKPVLLGKEKKVLMIVITFGALTDVVASVVIRETGALVEDRVTWNQVFLLAGFICCAIIFPIVSICSFSKSDRKADRNTLFMLFCVVVIGYVLVTRVGVFALMVLYNDLWVWIAADEIGSFVFYLMMFYMFRPVGESDYFVVDIEGEYKEAPKTVKG